MINMEVQVGWSLALNTTSLEFHEVQNRLKESIKNEVLHCISKDQMYLLEPNVTVNDVVFDIYVRLRDRSFEFAIIEKESY